jgi:hypothetical protein
LLIASRLGLTDQSAEAKTLFPEMKDIPIIIFAAAILICMGSCKKESAESKPLTVSTYAGTGEKLRRDGAVNVSAFSTPNLIVIDRSDNIYIAEYNLMRKISPDGFVSSFPDFKPPPFFAQGIFYGLNLAPDNSILAVFAPDMGDGPYLLFRFNNGIEERLLYAPNRSMLHTVAQDKAGTIYLGSWSSGVSKLNASTKQLEPFAGGTYGFEDGAGLNAKIGNIADMTIDASGNIYLSDYRNHSIRKISPDGIVITFAGTSEAGFKDGNGTKARFNNPRGLAIDKSGNIIVCDEGNHSIRKISPQGEVVTLAGNGFAGFTDGPAALAQFNFPSDVAINSLGQILVIDQMNYRIRIIK